MNINPMHTVVGYGIDKNIYLTNIEDETITELIIFPIAPWADKKALGDAIRKLGRLRGWY